MKKVCMLLLIAMAVLLTSCTIGGLPINRYAYMRVDYTAAANDRFEELIAAVQKQDSSGRYNRYFPKMRCAKRRHRRKADRAVV